jgi:hypothetical protein
MTEFEHLIEQLRDAFRAADRTEPGVFRFSMSVQTANGPCICAVAVAPDTETARAAAAKALTG